MPQVQNILQYRIYIYLRLIKLNTNTNTNTNTNQEMNYKYTILLTFATILSLSIASVTAEPLIEEPVIQNVLKEPVASIADKLSTFENYADDNAFVSKQKESQPNDAEGANVGEKRSLFENYASDNEFEARDSKPNDVEFASVANHSALFNNYATNNEFEARNSQPQDIGSGIVAEKKVQFENHAEDNAFVSLDSQPTDVQEANVDNKRALFESLAAETAIPVSNAAQPELPKLVSGAVDTFENIAAHDLEPVVSLKSEPADASNGNVLNKVGVFESLAGTAGHPDEPSKSFVADKRGVFENLAEQQEAKPKAPKSDVFERLSKPKHITPKFETQQKFGTQHHNNNNNNSPATVVTKVLVDSDSDLSSVKSKASSFDQLAEPRKSIDFPRSRRARKNHFYANQVRGLDELLRRDGDYKNANKFAPKYNDIHFTIPDYSSPPKRVTPPPQADLTKHHYVQPKPISFIHVDPAHEYNVMKLTGPVSQLSKVAAH